MRNKKNTKNAMSVPDQMPDINPLIMKLN
jgi:hypothetical protein